MRLPEDDPASAGSLLLALPSAYAPDIDSLKQGLELFAANNVAHLRHQSALRTVTVLGARFRSRQLEDAAGAQIDNESREDNADIAELEVEADADQLAWTPETVGRAMENMLARAAHMIRRARWYALLSESCLTWAPVGKHDGSRKRRCHGYRRIA